VFMWWTTCWIVTEHRGQTWRVTVKFTQMLLNLWRPLNLKSTAKWYKNVTLKYLKFYGIWWQKTSKIDYFPKLILKNQLSIFCPKKEDRPTIHQCSIHLKPLVTQLRLNDNWTLVTYPSTFTRGYLACT
jgi:hypothetical protein